MATTEFLDFTVAGFTKNGNPTAIPDQHSGETNVCYDADKIDDYLTSSYQPFTTGENECSISFWFKQDALTATQGWVFSFGATSANRSWECYNHSSGGIYGRWYTGGSISTRAESVDLSATTTDDSWHHIVMTHEDDAAGGVCHIYLDGSEVSYAGQSTAGGGFNVSGIPTTQEGVSIHGRSDGSVLGKGAVSRLKVWDGTTLSDAQVLAEYNSEVTAITGVNGQWDALLLNLLG